MSQVGRCEKALFLISQSLDRKLSLVESLSLRWHSFVCMRCRGKKEALVTMRRLLRLYREDSDKAVDSSNEMLSDKTKERIKEVLKKRMQEKRENKGDEEEGPEGPSGQ